MSTQLDRIIGAVLDSLRKSRILESGSVLATVSVLNADGTITATRNGDTYPKVRLVGGFTKPAVSDSVLIHRTFGGWVCLGSPQTSQAPRIQRGTGSVTTVSGDWTNATYTFPKPFATIPTVVVSATINTSVSYAGPLELTVIATTISGFTIRVKVGSTALPFAWIATDL